MDESIDQQTGQNFQDELRRIAAALQANGTPDTEVESRLGDYLQQYQNPVEIWIAMQKDGLVPADKSFNDYEPISSAESQKLTDETPGEVQ